MILQVAEQLIQQVVVELEVTELLVLVQRLYKELQ